MSVRPDDSNDVKTLSLRGAKLARLSIKIHKALEQIPNTAPKSVEPPGAGSVRPVDPDSANIASTRLCPRCGQKLISPESMGLCYRCGFCRSLQEAVKLPADSSRSILQLIANCRGLWQIIPGWLGVMLGGVAVIGLGSFELGRILPGDDRWLHTFWSTWEFAIGLGVLVVGHVVAFLMLNAYESGLGLGDLAISDQLWFYALEELPATRWPVWLGCWGLSMMFFSALFIGGLSYWFGY